LTAVQLARLTVLIELAQRIMKNMFTLVSVAQSV